MAVLKWVEQHLVLQKQLVVQELASLVLNLEEVAYTYREREGPVLTQGVREKPVLKSLEGVGPQNLLEEGLIFLVLN